MSHADGFGALGAFLALCRPRVAKLILCKVAFAEFLVALCIIKIKGGGSQNKNFKMIFISNVFIRQNKTKRRVTSCAKRVTTIDCKKRRGRFAHHLPTWVFRSAHRTSCPSRLTSATSCTVLAITDDKHALACVDNRV